MNDTIVDSVTITRRMFNIDGEREQANWDMAAILELQSVPLVSFRKKTGRPASYCKKREHVKLRQRLTLHFQLLCCGSLCRKRDRLWTTNFTRSHTPQHAGSPPCCFECRRMRVAGGRTDRPNIYVSERR